MSALIACRQTVLKPSSMLTPQQLQNIYTSTSEVAMPVDILIPSFTQSVCTASQVSAILGRPRPTIAGWMSRYEWLDIAPMGQGKTRLFSAAEIGLLIALRISISAGNMADTLGDSLDLVSPEIEAEYKRVVENVRLEEWGANSVLKPYIPMFEDDTLLLVQHGGGNNFLPTRSRKSTGAYIADLSGFELPEITLPLGQCLRNGWTRMLWLLNDFQLAS